MALRLRAFVKQQETELLCKSPLSVLSFEISDEAEKGSMVISYG